MAEGSIPVLAAKLDRNISLGAHEQQTLQLGLSQRCAHNKNVGNQVAIFLRVARSCARSVTGSSDAGICPMVKLKETAGTAAVLSKFPPPPAPALEFVGTTSS